jgi:hypothetical protein
LVLVERLFELTKNKLMKIPAFAWVFRHYEQARAWVRQTEVWKAIRALSEFIRESIGDCRAAVFRHHPSRRLQ